MTRELDLFAAVVIRADHNLRTFEELSWTGLLDPSASRAADGWAREMTARYGRTARPIPGFFSRPGWELITSDLQDNGEQICAVICPRADSFEAVSELVGALRREAVHHTRAAIAARQRKTA